MDRENKHNDTVSDAEDIELIVSLIVLERKLGHPVTVDDLNDYYDSLQISDLCHIIPFLTVNNN
jgi:hypothetical protein